MNEQIHRQLVQLATRFEALGVLMSDTGLSPDQYQEYAKEYAKLEPVVHAYLAYQETQEALISTKEMLKEPEFKALAQAEYEELKVQLEGYENSLKMLLVPEDPEDEGNAYIEIRAGTGGDEAAIFVGDLFRMYTRYAEAMRWQMDVMQARDSEQGGYKEIILHIQGQGVYGYLKFEAGIHRIQRVPVTESQGRVHTSAVTVAILPEITSIDEVTIDEGDLRIDTYRSSGAGGQHVNTTDSAVRITHLPTGIVVECQDERSQHKNKAKAMKLLQTKILDHVTQQQKAEVSASRKAMVGSGDRSGRIRTYNVPQGRVTDHRIGLTLYQLEEVLQGHVGLLIDPLRQAYVAEKLEQLDQGL